MQGKKTLAGVVVVISKKIGICGLESERCL